MEDILINTWGCFIISNQVLLLQRKDILIAKDNEPIEQAAWFGLNFVALNSSYML